MPTNLGTPMHVGNPGDRTTPLPVTTWQSPRPKKSSIDWAAIQAAQPAPVVEPAPEKTVESIRATLARPTPKPRKPRAPHHKATSTCTDCGTTIVATSTRCRPCSHAHRTPRRSMVNIDTARTEYQAGRTCPQIAADHGWPVISVRRQLQAAGVTMRDDRANGSGGANRLELTRPELPDLIRSLYLDQGMSQRDVAHHCQIGMNTVTRIMREHNIAARQAQSGGGDTLAGTRDRLHALGVTSAAIRHWARTNGHDVPLRGVVPNTLIDAYEQATA